MKERLLRGDVLEHERSRREDFDPIAKGQRYGLAPDVSIALWAQVRRATTNSKGQCDENTARARFVQLGELIARRGGQLGPEAFHWTQIDVASGRAPQGNLLGERAPGRTTQVSAEAPGRTRVALHRVPGRTTLVANHAAAEGDEPHPSQRFAAPLQGHIEEPSTVSRTIGTGDTNRGETVESLRQYWTGKRIPTSDLTASAPRRAPSRDWPGLHASTSRPVAPVASHYALRAAESNASAEDHVDAPLDQALRYSRGTPLAADLRRLLEGMFSQRFDDVLIHVDNSATTAATSIDAHAFTIANRIFFREDAYRPDTREGLELLAHELAHVLQWRQGRIPQVSGGHRVSNPGDALEREATATAQDVTRTAIAPARAPSGTRAPTIFATTSAAITGMAMRDGPEPRASLDAIPAGGGAVDRIGIVAWDRSPPLKLRSSMTTVNEANVISLLAFNTHLQVIKEFPGKWYFVSTQGGQLGYVAKDYVKTNLPEPNAQLHRVEDGLPGYAISIAERYYKKYADDWGQDLRFYVNVLAWVNKRTVPNTTSGWRDVRFNADEFIWVPTHEFARSLRGVVNSGSTTHNLADAIGIADFLDRVGELWDDFRTAIALSTRYIPEALGRHVETALLGVLESIVQMLVIAAAILAISTAVGAAVGALAGGVGAAPGAAAGFEVGMVLLNWLGLAMLVVWIGQSLVNVGSAFGTFLGSVWSARGDHRKLDLAARQFAEALGVLCGALLEGLVMYAVSIGATKAIGGLRGTRLGKAFNNAKSGEWLNERIRHVKAGEAPLATPKDVFSGLVRGVELVDARNSPLGEFDGIDVANKRFVENKSATGIDKPNPTTRLPQQTPAQWAAKQILKKTTTRIKALANAVATRGPGGQAAPALAEIQGFRHIHFMIDGESPALRAAVAAELATLRTANPGWTFTVEFGIKIAVPPVPGTSQPEDD